MTERSKCLQIFKSAEHGNALSHILSNRVKDEIRRIVTEVRITDGIINWEMKGSTLDTIFRVFTDAQMF
jgi:hypothetical protein